MTNAPSRAVIAALLAAVLAAVACSSQGSSQAGEAASLERTAETTPPAATAPPQPSMIPASTGASGVMTVEELVRRAEPAVVRVATPSGVGSGVIVGSDGYIVTNNHVVTDASGGLSNAITVRLSDGSEHAATVAGADPRSDLAVLRIVATGLSTLPLASLDRVAVGQDVVAIGYALDLKGGEGPSFTVTRGIVSAKNRGIDEASTILGAIQTDAAINHGNSGGPLLNLFGEVVGINTALAPDRVSGGVATGIGFAVGSDTVRAVYDEIRAHGEVRRGLLGIRSFEALRPAQARELGLPESLVGVYLDVASDLAPSGPASRAGLQAGDVIVAIDNYVVRTEADLAVALIYAHAGETVEVAVYRGGQALTIAVTLGTP